MRVIGIIAEYNPFHNGHKYLIEKARECVSDPRAIVMPVISGFFTQRGLPAVCPPQVRARQALLCGADVVLTRVDEIKVIYDGIHDPEMQLTNSQFSILNSQFLQPCDTGDAARNRQITAATVEYVKSHPEWRLSLQIHKILDIQ